MKSQINNLTRTQKKALLIAVVLAWLAKSIPLVSFVTGYYTIAFHELGHAFTGWFFAYVSIPTFDMINGGGVTYRVARPLFLYLVIFVFILAHLKFLKINAKPEKIKKHYLLFIAYLVVFMSPIHDWLISFMGAGGEIMFSFLIGWSALSKVKDKLNIKPVIYLFLSLVLWLNVVRFSWSLIFDSETKSAYLNGIQQVLGGNALTNDLVKLNESTGLSLNFYSWMLMFLSVFSLYKLISKANVAFVTKQTLKEYFKSLFNIIKIQIISIFNKFNN